MAEDRTFSAGDVLRIYCNHLTDLEKEQVKEWFKDTDGDCFDLPDVEIDILDLLSHAKKVGDVVVLVADKLSLLGAFVSGYIFGDDEAVPEEVEGIEQIINNNSESKTSEAINDIAGSYDTIISEVIRDRGLTDEDKDRILSRWEEEKKKAFDTQRALLEGIYTWNVLVPEQWEVDMQEAQKEYTEGIAVLYDTMAEYDLLIKQIDKAIGLEKRD